MAAGYSSSHAVPVLCSQLAAVSEGSALPHPALPRPARSLWGRTRGCTHSFWPCSCLTNACTASPRPQFVEKDPRLADSVVRALLKFWPLTNSHKEVLFLGELEEVLELTQVRLMWSGDPVCALLPPCAALLGIYAHACACIHVGQHEHVGQHAFVEFSLVTRVNRLLLLILVQRSPPLFAAVGRVCAGAGAAVPPDIALPHVQPFPGGAELLAMGCSWWAFQMDVRICVCNCHHSLPLPAQLALAALVCCACWVGRCQCPSESCPACAGGGAQPVPVEQRVYSAAGGAAPGDGEAWGLQRLACALLGLQRVACALLGLQHGLRPSHLPRCMPVHVRLPGCSTACLWQRHIAAVGIQHRRCCSMLLQVLPLVIGALEHNAKHHWNPAVHRCGPTCLAVPPAGWACSGLGQPLPSCPMPSPLPPKLHGVCRPVANSSAFSPLPLRHAPTALLPPPQPHAQRAQDVPGD